MRLSTLSKDSVVEFEDGWYWVENATRMHSEVGEEKRTSFTVVFRRLTPEESAELAQKAGAIRHLTNGYG